MLAKMGALLELKADQPKSETLHDLKQLATARQALIKDLTAAKARLAATIARQCIANAMSREVRVPGRGVGSDRGGHRR
jgi:transposase